MNISQLAVADLAVDCPGLCFEVACRIYRHFKLEDV